MANHHHGAAVTLDADAGPSGSAIGLGLGIAACALAALGWSYWPTITQLVKDWDDPNYSAGQLVPFVAIYLVWHSRRTLRQPIAPCWWGIGVVLAAQALRLFAFTFSYECLGRYSLIGTIWGVVLLLAGWRVFWRARWILLFLVLMVPLPNQADIRILEPLQTIATIGAVFVLSVLGMDCVREGHRIILPDGQVVGVIGQCSGLSMLMAFVIVAAAMAFLVNRPRWQKGTLFISSVPIAVAANIIRLAITVASFQLLGSATGKQLSHDLVGLIIMMPLAFVILLGELRLMAWLVVPDACQAGSGSKPAGRPR
jgi:exosortase